MPIIKSITKNENLMSKIKISCFSSNLITRVSNQDGKEILIKKKKLQDYDDDKFHLSSILRSVFYCFVLFVLLKVMITFQ